ncbi:MAG: hypothetical protein QNJ32_25705 [Xenococcaceae cyanobacterium MO_167.B27]|nr:hypothetical protein [Xenococcaceae cyanobacterium MO_167.B27]
MKEETNIRHELASILQDLPAEKVKTAVIKWLSTEKGDIADLKQNLSLDNESNESQMIYGSIDTNLDFIPLTSEEMITQSLEALNEYQLHRRGVSQQAMENWAASLGTDDELPCPR